MAEYYKTRPSTVATLDGSAENDIPTAKEARTMSEYDKHRKTLLSDDVVEGWSSELRQYLTTMQRDVEKDTDIVKWWQVSKPTYLHVIICSLKVL